MEILILLVLVHFLPTLIALLRGHHNGFAIFLTNLPECAKSSVPII